MTSNERLALRMMRVLARMDWEDRESISIHINPDTDKFEFFIAWGDYGGATLEDIDESNIYLLERYQAEYPGLFLSEFLNAILPPNSRNWQPPAPLTEY